jgi:hypothetical protein
LKVSKQYIQVPADLLRSPAYAALNIHEIRTLRRIEIEHVEHGGKDNGRLPVTHADIKRHGVGRKYIPSSLRVLQGLGLIDCTERGRAGSGEFRKPSLWRLTYITTAQKGASGTVWIEPTHEWSKIETAEAADQIVSKHRARDKRPRRPPSRRPKLRVVQSEPKPDAK